MARPLKKIAQQRSISEALEKLSKQFQVVELNFVRYSHGEAWWGIKCKYAHSLNPKYDISAGGYKTAWVALKEAVRIAGTLK